MPSPNSRSSDLNTMGHAPQVTIHVSAENINTSVQRASGHCMIAEAVKATKPDARFVSVDLQTIRWTLLDKAERYTYLTPRPVQIALVEFDQGVLPKPFKFTIRGGATTSTGVWTGRPRMMKAKGKNASKIPRIVGGKLPPKAALSNTTNIKGRRSFGLRSLKM